MAVMEHTVAALLASNMNWGELWMMTHSSTLGCAYDDACLWPNIYISCLPDSWYN